MSDRLELAQILDTFFTAFTSGPGAAERVNRLRGAFLPGATVVAPGGAGPQAMTVEDFLAPRQRMLTDGTLTGFREWASAGRLEVFGDIAAWFGRYAKEGTHLEGRGWKSLQFVRTAEGWRISSVAWDDERPGQAPYQQFSQP
jgi:hypothetical protein